MYILIKISILIKILSEARSDYSFIGLRLNTLLAYGEFDIHLSKQLCAAKMSPVDVYETT